MDTSFIHAPPHCFSDPNDESIQIPILNLIEKSIIYFFDRLPTEDKSIVVISKHERNLGIAYELTSHSFTQQNTKNTQNNINFIG